MSLRRCSNRNIALSIFIVSVSLFLLPAILSYFRFADKDNLSNIKRDVQGFVHGVDVIQSISLKRKSNSSAARLKNDRDTFFEQLNQLENEMEQIVILPKQNVQPPFERLRKNASQEIVRGQELQVKIQPSPKPAAAGEKQPVSSLDAARKLSSRYRHRFPPTNESADVGHYLRYRLVPTRAPALDFVPNVVETPEEFKEWEKYKKPYCDGRFQTYSSLFVMLRDVIVDQSQAEGRAGGEAIEDVLNQNERDEYFTLSMGYFQLKCDMRPGIVFQEQNHLNEWLLGLATQDLSTTDVDKVVDDFTIAVQRYEYVNLYHTMTDWYNAYIVMRFFGKTPEETHIVWIDAHPKGGLDGVWSTLFSSATRASALPRRTKFTNLVWGIIGYSSTMLRFNEDHLPLVEDFRQFFLTRHGIAPSSHKLNCSDVSVLFVWRHDYVAHPRNPSGSIARKIANELQLVAETRKALRFISSRVIGVQIDRLDMTTQLQLIANTDILIGMHGAGLTHTLFLPPHAALIELVPAYAAQLEHFMSMTRWRDLHYEWWMNEDLHNEMPGQKTYIPPHIVRDRVAKSLRKMCGRSQKFVIDFGDSIPSTVAINRTIPAAA